MSAQGDPPTSVGLSPTEARSAGGPKFICVDTEARSEIRQTTSAAPTEAANANVLRRVGRDRRLHETVLGIGNCISLMARQPVIEIQITLASKVASVCFASASCIREIR